MLMILPGSNGDRARQNLTLNHDGCTP